MEKILVITRHGKRDTFDRSLDNGLNEKGQVQARQIAKLFQARFKKIVPVILSSPKVRCVETVEPTAADYEVQLIADPRLDESHTSSSTKEFYSKLDSFIHWWKSKAPHLTLICSHGDVIPELFQRLVDRSYDLKKGGWATIHLDEEGRVKLAELLDPPLEG